MSKPHSEVFKAIVALIALVFLMHPEAANAQSVRHPNVLFIFVDDLRPELGCYGNSLIKTPNIDRFARQSLVMRNHYVQVPTCGASRFSLLTGMLPRKRAHLRNDAIERFISAKPEDQHPETFVHHFRRNGYHTVGIGKISHSADGLVYPYRGDPENAKQELPYSWDELLFDAGKWGTGWNAFFGYGDGTNRQSMNNEVKPYEAVAGGDTAYVDGLTASLAVAKLTELSSGTKPFFLGVGFFKPHLPFTAPKKYWDLYADSDLPLTASPDLPKGVHSASFHHSGEFNSYRAGEEHPSLTEPISEAYARTLIHAYYAAVSYTDAQIGRVLQALEESGVADETIVIIWSDHGWQLGDYRVWGKHTLTEKALRSPLIISVPGLTDEGRTWTGIVSAIDVYPTLMELCRMPMPYTSDGESFAPIIRSSPSGRRRHHAFGYFNEGITVRTNRFRLTRYFRNEEPTIELYDHRKDPHENENVAARRPGKVRKLMRTLEQGNTGLYNNNQ